MSWQKSIFHSVIFDTIHTFSALTDFFPLCFPSGTNYVCPSDWLLSQGKCYMFSTFSKTWNESQHDCLKLQAHLPVIQNSKELVRSQKQFLSVQGWITRYNSKCGWFIVIAFEHSLTSIQFMRFSRQESWSDLPTPSPVGHVLSGPN